MNKIVIIGAGGHAKVIADIAAKNGYKDISFLDDNVQGSHVGFPILGAVQYAERLNDGTTDFVIGIGSNEIRKSIALRYPELNYVALIHSTAIIGSFVEIGRGTVVMAGAIMNSCASVGAHCIVNSAAVIEHDSVLEDFTHISPNVTLGGAVRVGEGTHIGIGASVCNNISICADSVIGAGAVVVKDIEAPGTYVGVPCRRIK